MHLTIRTLVAGAFFGVAAVAGAQSVFFSSQDTTFYSYYASGQGQQPESYGPISYQSGGLAPITFLSYVLDFDSSSDGFGYFASAGNTNALNFVVSNLNLAFATSGSSYSGSADWVQSSGDGVYANTTASGTLAFTFEGSSGMYFPSGAVFAGYISTTPEPASYAVFGLGALVFVRRRRGRRS